ncbi:hypothetical protein SASPL_133428 [Salvia splendens]|uniref:Uncharacterized protein n=1 Tax=Salvia splendens TaxID=180675 RepID=A0A8X8X493_SALSN|nr:hypothetical protein SASPL_133428 [Salvia splendens]
MLRLFPSLQIPPAEQLLPGDVCTAVRPRRIPTDPELITGYEICGAAIAVSGLSGAYPADLHHEMRFPNLCLLYSKPRYTRFLLLVFLGFSMLNEVATLWCLYMLLRGSTQSMAFAASLTDFAGVQQGWNGG